MAQTQYTEQDAISLAQKLEQFTQTLTPGEQAAWETIERHVSTLIPSEDADVQGFAFTPDAITMMGQERAEDLRNQAAQMSRAGSANPRAGLWYRLVTHLNPPRRDE